MISRRGFLQSSAAVMLLPLVPKVVRSATTGIRIRPSWDTFCQTPLYDSFVEAIGKMRSDWDATKPEDWAYWVDVHKNFCPHKMPYFLAWHRGLLYRFEEKLQEVSGNPDLVIPYWDYYTSPQIPPQFLDTSSPLWRKQRTGDDVTGALSLDPFADDVVNFKRGLDNAFEPAIETAPHNPVHNLIGGAMGDVAISPRDPLFWVHHANIDRLWLAWFMAGNGRTMPRAYWSYWDGDLQYGDAVATVPRLWTRNPSRYMLYDYDDHSMPTTLPTSPPPTSSTASPTMALSSFALVGTAPIRPASVQSAPLNGSRPLDLDERSISVDVPLSAQNANQVRSLLISPVDAQAASKPDPLRLVLDGVRLSSLGRKGGYFYKVLVNLPETAGASGRERAHLLGHLGPFEISVAQMGATMRGKGMQAQQHGQPDAQFVFPLSKKLREIWPDQLDRLSISFVRVDGSRHPAKGRTIHIKDFRLEADT